MALRLIHNWFSVLGNIFDRALSIVEHLGLVVFVLISLVSVLLI